MIPPSPQLLLPPHPRKRLLLHPLKPPLPKHPPQVNDKRHSNNNAIHLLRRISISLIQLSRPHNLLRCSTPPLGIAGLRPIRGLDGEGRQRGRGGYAFAEGPDVAEGALAGLGGWGAGFFCFCCALEGRGRWAVEGSGWWWWWGLCAGGVRACASCALGDVGPCDGRGDCPSWGEHWVCSSSGLEVKMGVWFWRG